MRVLITCLLGVMAVYSCVPIEDDDDGDGAGGEAGEAGDAGDGGKAGNAGKAGDSGSSGRSSGGASSGEAGDAGETGVSGSAGASGKAGDSGSSGDGSSGAESAGQAGTDGTTTVGMGEQRPDLDGSQAWDDFIELSVEEDAVVLPSTIYDNVPNTLELGEDGTFYLCNGTYVAKSNSSFEPMWEVVTYEEFDVFNVRDCTIAEDTGVYAVGSDLTDTLVARLGSDGDLLWSTTIQSSETDYGMYAMPSPEGGVYVVGASEGQLPGQPPEASGNPFVAKFSPEGEREWIYQAVLPTEFGSANTPVGVTTDNSGNVYVSIGCICDRDDGGLMRVSSSGKLDWYSVPPEGDDGVRAVTPGFLVAHQDTGTVFSLNAGLSAFTSDGEFAWYRHPREEVEIIDEAEGVEWTGSFYRLSDNSLGNTPMVVSDDALYVVGQYANYFEYGSVERPTIYSMFVARYDLGGDLVWFQQYVLPAPDSALPYQAPTASDVFLDGSTLIVPALTRTSTEREGEPGITYTTGAIILLRLDTEDGSRL